MHAPAELASTPIDEILIEQHVGLLHHLAQASGVKGVLVLFAVGENPATGAKVGPHALHFSIGDTKGMADQAKAWARHPHLNIYAPFAVFRKSLERGKKGEEADVVAVLAIVADLDNDTDKSGVLPLPAPYVIESSPGNFQAVYPLSRALTVTEAKPIAQALADAAGCDPRTKDTGGVWRVPGTLNWPNKKKLDRGRSPVPQFVIVAKAWTSSLIEPETLAEAVKGSRRQSSDRQEKPGPSRASDASVEELLGRCSAAYRKLIKSPPEPFEDRLAVAFSVVLYLLQKTFSAEDIKRLIEAPPKGIGARCADGKDLDADIRRAQEKADQGAGEPLPLFPPLPPAEPFPVEALGPVLSAAASAIARKVQVPEAIAGQSVLAAAALAAQAHADVVLPYGQSRPLSQFLVTVAASGDRKSTADNEALRPVRKREKTLKEEHEAQHQQWRIDHAAWNAEKRKIEADKKLNFADRRQALQELGPEPEPPLHPFLTSPDPTVEGLAKACVNAPAALGVFTAEGGMFVGGVGMSQDHRLKTAATFSELWDGRPIKRVRATDGVSILSGRRLSMHLIPHPIEHNR